MTYYKKLFAVLVIALCMPLPLLAAEWSAEPTVSLRTGINDNIRLTTSDHDNVWETSLSPSVRFGVSKGNQGLTGDAGFAIRRFTGGSGRESSDALDREDYHLRTDAFHNTLRNNFSANLDYTIDSTQDSELDQTGSLIQERATRKRLTLGPAWRSTLNQLTSLETSYQFTNVTHDDETGGIPLVSYDNHNINASLIRILTPRMQGTFSAGYSNYKPDNGSNSRTLSLQAGLTRNLTETLVASFLAGHRETTSDTFINTGFCIGGVPGASYPTCIGGIPVPVISKGELDTSGLVFSASIVQTLEAGSLSATLSRSTIPDSNGELLDATRLNLSGIHNFTETLRALMTIEYTENETIVNRLGLTTNLDDESFFRVTPKLLWRLQREWELGGEYRYSRSDKPGSAATSNAIYMTVNYLGLRRSVSR